MKKLIFIALVTVCSNAMKAQNLIAVQNGGTPAFYTQVTAAFSAADDGDTIYIPGGTWSIGNLYINKSIHAIGVGNNPDSAQACGYTFLSGTIYLQQGCSHGSLWGLYISGSLRNNSSTDTIVDYSIRRCRITNTFFMYNYTGGLISENVFEGQIFDNQLAVNNSFNNNIFISNVGYFGSGNNFKNNLFLSSGYTAWTFAYCLFENNIIFTSNFVDPMTNCIFNNNLFLNNIVFPIGTNLGSNNIVNQTQSSIFVNQSGTTFSYSQNYHLQETCPGKNAGTDGTDIGIYGGMFPWKEGALPFNPHVRQKVIQQSTDSNGNLNVNITVGAQSH